MKLPVSLELTIKFIPKTNEKNHLFNRNQHISQACLYHHDPKRHLVLLPFFPTITPFSYALRECTTIHRQGSMSCSIKFPKAHNSSFQHENKKISQNQSVGEETGRCLK